jgi:Phytanoyl-CoA dioxygenase (PhyH)
MVEVDLAPSTEKGTIGIMHLKRYWEKSMAKRNGELKQDSLQEEWNTDTTLLSALGLGLEQTICYLYVEMPAFDQFEEWILQTNGPNISKERINEFNELLLQEIIGDNNGAINNVLDDNDLEFWNQNGYVIVREAVSKEDCNDAINALAELLNIDINDASTWYNPHPAKQGIMIQLFQHPALEKNRRSKKIRSAYEQLWGRKDLWMNTDRVSFNPPENERWKFPGPSMHWDVSLELPIPFGLQGLLYLSDTKENQGAFSLVPGFHNRIEQWINSLPDGANPREQDVYRLGVKSIAANAGDFIIWHQALPHGSRPNTATVPRIVQYINYMPIDAAAQEKWK